jgi:hypothetical protein
VRKVLAEAAQDGEAMRVEVTPIVEGLVCDPCEGSEQVDSVATSEDGEHVRSLRQCKEVDFVFGDDDVGARRGVVR